jgi:hypothetical protein
MVIPGTDIQSSRKAIELAQKYAQNGLDIWAAVGIHPHHVYEHKEDSDELAELEKLLNEDRVVAVGEIGLDRHQYEQTKYEEYHLSSGGVVSLSVTPNELSHLSVVAVQGNVGSVSEYENPETLPTSVKNSSVALKREFLVNGLVTTTFKESDLVEVRLYPTILSGALDTRFQIVDYVPSGLRIITPEYASSLTYEDGNVSCNPWYPYEINGQLVKYSIGKDWQSHRMPPST